MTNDEILRSAGLYKKNLQTGESGYTLACILLFGTDEAILSALPHHKTDAIYRVEEMDRYDDRDVIRCNFLFVMQQQKYALRKSFIWKLKTEQ